MKICSLLPSTTEIVYALGLEDQLVGVTHECDYPPGARSKPVVTRSHIHPEEKTGTEIDQTVTETLAKGESLYALDVELLSKLEPDLIITQKLCAVCAVAYDQVVSVAENLPGRPQVASLEPTTLAEIFETIRRVGELTGTSSRADRVVGELKERVDRVRAKTSRAPSKPRVLSLEWVDPPFGGGQWHPELVEIAGGEDGLGNPGGPSPRLDWKDVESFAPEVVVLMPCGFEVPRAAQEYARASLPKFWDGLPAVQSGRVFALNGNAYFNRPGPRIVDSLELLAGVVQPKFVELGAEAEGHWIHLGSSRVGAS